jgi:hypothetical protein
MHKATFRNTFDVVALYGLVQSFSYDSDWIGTEKYPNQPRNKPTETLKVNQNWEVARLANVKNCSGGHFLPSCASVLGLGR